MEYLDFGINALSGPLPRELDLLTELILLGLSGNNFSSPLPSEIGNIRTLQQLLHWMLLVICVPSHTIYQFDSRRRDPLRSVLVKSLLNKVLMKMNVKKSALPQWKSVKCAQQEGGVECGYYVMKFMQDIFKSCKEVQDLEKVFTTPREGPFTKEELDEVRDKWTTYFNDCELPSV
ncbi:protein TOO MANY MOUTHS isoform X2 [Spinacia oleracea]|uniref:Protein TOO MANY MOUTHS-like isoform X2 n=1 Tax=Spinacia oleracea TaxID=3562 RepID=A0A9R0ISM3_SPIOL|nr:protein TOO MANY MOUTHS-like isoform X2 [Spinacia oleracea]XP_021854254.1 protein TOO MANY MOUTHS-like isoform X2 [Spinacia oleracea]